MPLNALAAELAERPGLARFWGAAHRRLESAGGLIDGVVAHVASPSPDERLAIDRLLGRRSRGVSIRVSLRELDTLLVERAGASLVEIVTVAIGEVRDRPGDRAARAAARDQTWRVARSHGVIGRHPGLADWLDELETGARVRDGFDDTLRGALDVLVSLPSPEPIGRGRLAAVVLGDSHALDDGRRVTTLVLGGLAWLAGRDPAASAADRRAVWSDAGVLVDETSSTVLTLGLAVDVVGPVTAAASLWVATALPLPVTLAAAAAERWRVASGTIVWSCENPGVLEAVAAALGPAAPPMVCVLGNPSVAARTLITSLVGGGAQLRYHGDFGAGGLAIGNVVIGELGAVPWRFGAADHASAVSAIGARLERCPPLRGRVPEVTWDAALAAAVSKCGVEVQEEHVLDVLLADLAVLLT